MPPQTLAQKNPDSRSDRKSDGYLRVRACRVDGEAIKSRVVNVVASAAKCRCKRWVVVPVCLVNSPPVLAARVLPLSEPAKPRKRGCL